ncbi:heat stress transcription factor B-1-like [Typha angustifolia]|uniref:heat stress transcription factor B-1-like n=1 Tax=Typha angustifolia TaxID=59011 RepID=UPI003C309B05
MAQKSRGGPAPFLTKTHQMVEERETADVISWEENGRSFVVWKPVEFARDLLPLHFKHSNFSSFIRQLNTYGFRKVAPDRWEFANENFRRGELSLLASIHRRKVATPLPHPSSITNSGDVHSSSSIPSPPPSPLQDLLGLTNENEQLKKHNQILNKELMLAKRHCEELLVILSKFLDVKAIDLKFLMQDNATLTLTKREEKEEEGEQTEEEGSLVKLFGVHIEERKKSGKRKRGWCDEGDHGCMVP